jgi:hypothetical protein
MLWLIKCDRTTEDSFQTFPALLCQDLFNQCCIFSLPDSLFGNHMNIVNCQCKNMFLLPLLNSVFSSHKQLAWGIGLTYITYI